MQYLDPSLVESGLLLSTPVRCLETTVCEGIALRLAGLQLVVLQHIIFFLHCS
jgi:hypothetical protein